MGDIKWIKITTDMFDNRKIKHLRKLPEGNSIVLIWVMLLTMAGRCNAGGMIFLTENIPYTPKMLADELGFEENTVRLALKSLEELDMVRMDGILTVPGWEEYQNIEGMDRIREQAKKRVANYRERQKNALLEAKKTGEEDVTLHVTLRNAADIDIDKDIKNKNKKNIYEEFAAGDSALLDALKEYDSFRKKVKKPLTENAKERLVKRLEAFPRSQWIDILHKSIDKGWTDVYPLDEKKDRQGDHSFTPTEF